jgi:hypothetical protein
LILIASHALIGCGSGTSSSTPSSSTGTPASGPPVPALLNGNWNLAGNRALAQYPLLSLSLIVNGNQITANGDEAVQCSNRLGGVGGTFSLTGQIASDGTFQLAETATGMQLDDIQVAVTGTAPTADSNTWTGTYSFTELAGYTSCIVNQTGQLTAAPLASFTGTYNGTLTSSSGNVTLSLAAQQGAAATTSVGTYYLPLTANLTVSGSPCFTSGTTNTYSISQIQGDLANLSFTMSDGSQAYLNVVYADPGAATLTSLGFFIFTGQCSGAAYGGGTLTRQ